MAALEEHYEFKGSLEKVFKGIKSYEKYAERLPGVSNIEILDPIEDGSSCQVRYDLNLIKKFHYILNMYETPNTSISWELADSNLMKSNSGSWTLEEAPGGKTVNATYRLDIKFRGLVPSAVTSKVAKVNLPAMFEGFQRIIDSV